MNLQVGQLLREWRVSKRYSQLQLSLELNISSKHISFIETGRSNPSKDIIIKIGHFLATPKREINTALHTAGYAAIYHQLPLSDKHLKPVNHAIDHLIDNHMPYPALVLNQDWDVVKLNKSAQTLMHNIGFSTQTNLLEALIADKPDSSSIINWHETISLLLMRLRCEMSAQGGSDKLKKLERQLAACLPESISIVDTETIPVVLPTSFAINDKVLSFFSLMTNMGGIQDVSISEYKIELMFPSDELTQHFLSE